MSYIPSESEAARVGAIESGSGAEDLDATVIETWKREARPAYEGCTGYQPMLALWAEAWVLLPATGWREKLADGLRT